MTLSSLAFEVFPSAPVRERLASLPSSSRGLRCAPRFCPDRAASCEAFSLGVSRPFSARHREATYTGSARPGCAASSGFLSLLTLSSSRNVPALFHAGSAHGVRPFRGFPFLSARSTSLCPCPSWPSCRRSVLPPCVLARALPRAMTANPKVRGTWLVSEAPAGLQGIQLDWKSVCPASGYFAALLEPILSWVSSSPGISLILP